MSGQTLPGELNDGELYKQRTPAWVFTYAPEAIFAMVKRIHPIAGAAIADALPTLTLKNSLHMLDRMARAKNVRVESGAVGLGGWIAEGRRVIKAHLDSHLWDFSDGEPVNWRREDSTWVPRRPDALLTIVPDALAHQCTEETMLACDHPTVDRRLGPTPEELAPTLHDSSTSREARVSPNAFIGPGVRIEGASVVEEGAFLFRTVVKDAVVRKNVKAYRSVFERSEVDSPEVNSTVFIGTTMKGQAGAKGCRAVNSRLSQGCRLDPFSSVTDATISMGAIIGGIAKDVVATSNLFLVHPQGYAENLIAVPSVIEVDGKPVELSGLPMFGGGARVYGLREKPVCAECCFVGSNSIIRAGCYIGLGCFVVDGLDEDEGLLPFTLSKGPGPRNDLLSAVLFQHPTIVISSIIAPTYHGTDPVTRQFVAALVTGKIEEARAAIRWAMSIRQSGQSWDAASPYAVYANLRHYTDAQLANGLRGFDTALGDGRWRMEFRDGELRFAGEGHWEIRDATARWIAARP